MLHNLSIAGAFREQELFSSARFQFREIITTFHGEKIKRVCGIESNGTSTMRLIKSNIVKGISLNLSDIL